MPKTNYQILVNFDNKIDENYYKNIILPSLAEVEFKRDNNVNFRAFGVEDKKVWLEKETAEKFSQLRDYITANGIIYDISSGFLTVEQQTRKYLVYLAKFGEEYTKKSICLPWFSEHNCGLCADTDIFLNGKWGGIAPDSAGNINDETKFIHKSLPKFGFVLRFPKGKEEITKVKFESWHIRYVQEGLAKHLFKNQLALEEYYKNK